MSKLLYSWLFISPSEHHHTTQTSKFNNFFNGASTMLNNVFNMFLYATSKKQTKIRQELISD